MSLVSKIRRSVKASSQKMFFWRDFEKFNSDATQVRRALRILVGEGVLIQTGGGSYVKTIISKATGNTIPSLTLEEMGRLYLQKKDIRFDVSQAVKNYNSGLTTQIPVNPSFVTQKKVTAKIGYKGKYVNFC